jgi:hypothetical protein
VGRTVCTEPQCLYKGALYLTSVPVQGCTLPYLSACTKGALYLTSVPVQGVHFTSSYNAGRYIEVMDCKKTRRNIENIHGEMPGEVSRKIKYETVDKIPVY